MFRLFKPSSYFPFLVTILACLDQYPDPLTLLIWILSGSGKTDPIYAYFAVSGLCSRPRLINDIKLTVEKLHLF
jgi:hypothetical protein